MLRPRIIQRNNEIICCVRFHPLNGHHTGKAAVYTATAGVKPSQILPITLDVGCETDAIREDPLYIGLPQRRVRGDAYDELVDETVTALRARYGPALLVHWEDFASTNSYRLLAKYRAQVRTSTTWDLFNSCFQCPIMSLIPWRLSGRHSCT